MRRFGSVLLIGGDDTANFIAKWFLSNMGLADYFVVATTGKEALPLLEQAALPNPVLLILDRKLPDMLGIELLEHCQRLHESQQPAPCVLIATLSTPLQQEEKRRLQALPFALAEEIPRPLTTKKILGALENCQR